MDCWPLHPQPLPDEIFSSWIYRTSRANGIKFYSLCRLVAPEERNVYTNFDHIISQSAVREFARKLKTTYRRAFETTLDSYAGYLFENATKKGNMKTCLLHTGISSNELNRFPLQICPLCLSEGEPYFRKRWRVSLVTVCTEHECKLLDQCPECLSPIKPLKHDSKNVNKPFKGKITSCFNCGLDLASCSTKSANKALVEETEIYEEVLEKGFVELQPHKWIYSFSYFYVIRHLIRVLGLKDESVKESFNEMEPDSMTLPYRYAALKKLTGIFKNWPYCFLEFCEQNKLYYSDFTSIQRTKFPIPYWLDSAIKPNIYRPNLNPTEESVVTAINYMRRTNRRMSLLGLNKMLGFVDSQIAKRIFKEIVG